MYGRRATGSGRSKPPARAHADAGLEPQEDERGGYVPNVVYSCGAIVRDRTLLLPYGVADDYTAFGTLDLDRLLAAMR